MEINETRNGPYLVLEPVGHLDTRTANDFEKRVVELLGMGEKYFVVDLVSTEYISSAGLRVLLMLAKKLGASNEALVLCSLNESVREVFEVAGFTGVFTIAPDRAAAVANAVNKPTGARIFNLAARLLAIRKYGNESPSELDPLAERIAARAARLMAIAEERDEAKEKLVTRG